MNAFDASIVHFLNQFARRSEAFDAFVLFVADEPLLKGGIMALCLWAGWASPGPGRAEKREAVLAAVAATIVTLVFTKVLRHYLPFRIRPLLDSDLGFQLPYQVTTAGLWNWSSFPSDTSAMLFALGTGLLFASRRWGCVALVYGFFFGCLPRIYLGYHYPTDILAGALIGAGTAAAIGWQRVRRPLAYFPLRWSRQHPAGFYALMFLVTSEIANVFENARKIITFLYQSSMHYV